jgi:hypothetical protein
MKSKMPHGGGGGVEKVPLAMSDRWAIRPSVASNEHLKKYFVFFFSDCQKLHQSLKRNDSSNGCGLWNLP